MKDWLQSARAPKARGVLVLCILAILAGGTALVTSLTGADAARAFGALIASWLFFAGLTVGALAFAAIMQLSGARWSEPLIEVARGLTRFIPVAAVLLLVILLGVGTWAPWYHHLPEQQSFWLDTPFFASREILGSAALFGFAFLWMRPGATSRSPRWAAVAYCLVFAVVLSFWAFDFILGADLRWASTLIGPYLFVGAFISGAALVTLLALGSGRLDRRQRHDAAALTVAMGVFWGYLFWSQYLTIWYGNLPDEIEFFLRRSAGGWQIEAVLVAVCVFLVPLLLLMHGRAKESRPLLTIAVVAQLVGLWLERQLLIVPSVSKAGSTPFDIRGVLIALGLLGIFVLSTRRMLAHDTAQTGAPAPAH